jgi:hypothetical protein
LFLQNRTTRPAHRLTPKLHLGTQAIHKPSYETINQELKHAEWLQKVTETCGIRYPTPAAREACLQGPLKAAQTSQSLTVQSAAIRLSCLCFSNVYSKPTDKFSDSYRASQDYTGMKTDTALFYIMAHCIQQERSISATTPAILPEGFPWCSPVPPHKCWDSTSTASLPVSSRIIVSGHYPSSCLLFKTRRFGGWTLSPSSGKTLLSLAADRD